MVGIVLVITALLAVIHLCFLSPKAGKLDYVYVLVLMIVMGLNSFNADYAAYDKIYQNVCGADTFAELMKVHSDKGYLAFCWIASAIGLDFTSFRFLIFAASLYIVFAIARKLQVPICVLFLAYTIYPMFMDIIQIRNFIISIAFLFSIYCYAQDTFKWYAIGVVSMIVAMTIQPLAGCFFLFIVFYKIYHSRRFCYIAYLPIALGFSAIIIKFIIDAYWIEITEWLNIVVSIFSRGSQYVGHQVLTSRIFKIYLVVIILTWLIYRAKKYLSSLECVNAIQKKFVELSFVAYLYLICWMPFFALNINLATRLPRDFFLLAYMSLGLYVRESPTKKEKWLMVFAMVFLAYFFGLVDLYIGSERFNVYVILKNNFLL